MFDTNSSAPNPPSTTLSTTTDNFFLLLHPSDYPGALFISVLLHEDNYTEWTTELSKPIQAIQKLGFLKGSLVKPTSEPDIS